MIYDAFGKAACLSLGVPLIVVNMVIENKVIRMVMKLKSYRNFAALCVLLLTFVLFTSCVRQPLVVSASGLAEHVEESVSVRGKIVHICPVDRMKLKLMLADGTTIQVVPADGYGAFAVSEEQDGLKCSIRWPGSSDELTYCESGRLSDVVFSGVLVAKPINRFYADSLYYNGILNCHVNYERCLDSEWVSAMWADSSAFGLLEGTHDRLLQQIEQSENKQILVYTLKANGMGKP